MNDGHCFISYSNGDATDFGPQLADQLEGGHPFIDTWIDVRNILAGETWDEKVPEAIKTCRCFLFVMTTDSIAENSICADEWDLALSYKKPILVLRLHANIEPPFRLGKRQWIDFSNNSKAGMAKLRLAIQRLDSTEGQIEILKDRLADANRDLIREENEKEKLQIQTEIDELNAEIKANEFIKKDPEKAKKQTRKNINAGLERDRQPINPASTGVSSKFINPRPGSIPDYFEGRQVETEEIAEFLQNDFQRIMTINGRAGSGKTVLTCRVLQQLENGRFPNELGEFKVGGILYLSEISNYKINVANIFSGLLQLIEPEKAEKVNELYKEAKVPVDEKIRALLAVLPTEPIILLMDNFEDLLNSENEAISDQELNTALITILKADSHNLKILITTRELPRQLNMIETARQYIKHLDEGLPSPDAENVLRKMDKDGHAGLRDAPNELLGRIRIATLGYPRALEALYAILRVDRYSNVEELLIEELPDTVVQKFVGEAFSRLDSVKQKIIQTLAVFNRPVSYAAVDYALQFHIPGLDSAPILERLVSMHFVRREAKRYFLHPADRDYALSRMPSGDINKKIGQGARARTWDQYSLTLRAADYFVEVRKPRTEWKKLDDLSAQLAEFDLRCTAGNYDTAALILNDIHGDYLLLWGHYHFTLALHVQIKDKIVNQRLSMSNLNGMGLAYRHIGKIAESISCFTQGLNIAQTTNDYDAEGIFLGNLGTAFMSLGDTHKAIEHYERAKKNNISRNEDTFLGNLGNAYADLGDIYKAINFQERALAYSRKLKDFSGEGRSLGNLGSCYSKLGNIHQAIDAFEKSLAITQRISYRDGEQNALSNLGMAYDAIGESHKGLEFQERALIIAQQIGERRSEACYLYNKGVCLVNLEDYKNAREDFRQAILIADEILFQHAQNYARSGLALVYLLQNDLANALITMVSALQYDIPLYNHAATVLYGIITLRQGEKETAREAFTKSIAQADEILAKTPDFYDALDAKGLALCGLALCARDDGQRMVDDGKIVAEAMETFSKARKIAPHAGVVKSVLRLFDELVKCDEEGILKDVRKVIEGTE